MMYDMEARQIDSSKTRFPAPRPGQPIIVGRYGSPKGVIIHMDDFELFERYRRIFGQRVPYETKVSSAAVTANQLAERGGDEPDLDAESLASALGE